MYFFIVLLTNICLLVILYLGENMKIKKITKMKNNKYKIILENNETITTYDEIILSNNILYKKEIDNDLYNKIYNESLEYDLYNKILKFILSKMRSSFEIQKYMSKLDIDSYTQKKIMIKLENNNLINDYNFTSAYIADKINLSNVGKEKIKKELLEHKIDINLINEILNKYNDEIFIEKLNKLILKRSKNQKYTGFKLKQKLTNELLNLGFELNMIKEQLDKYNFTNNNDLLEKEYKKIYKKLSTKYEDNELYYKIKEKLYLKGFTNEEINEYKEKTEN